MHHGMYMESECIVVCTWRVSASWHVHVHVCGHAQYYNVHCRTYNLTITMCRCMCNMLIGKREEEEGETPSLFLFHLPHSPLSPGAPVPPSSLPLLPYVSPLHGDVPPHAVCVRTCMNKLFTVQPKQYALNESLKLLSCKPYILYIKAILL